MRDEQLSQHFKLSEFLKSDTAHEKALSFSRSWYSWYVLFSPTEVHLKTLRHTALYCLEKLRALLCHKYGECSVRITSGYRSAKLNTKVKGSKTSEHLKGQAADIEAKILKTGKIIPYTTLYEDIKGWVKEGKMSVNQCIQEHLKMKKMIKIV